MKFNLRKIPAIGLLLVAANLFGIAPISARQSGGHWYDRGRHAHGHTFGATNPVCHYPGGWDRELDADQQSGPIHDGRRAR